MRAYAMTLDPKISSFGQWTYELKELIELDEYTPTVVVLWLS